MIKHKRFFLITLIFLGTKGYTNDCVQQVTGLTDVLYSSNQSNKLTVYEVEKLVSLCPKFPEVYIAYAFALHKENKYDQAIKAWSIARDKVFSSSLSYDEKNYKSVVVSLYELHAELSLKRRVDAFLSLEKLKRIFSKPLNKDIASFLSFYLQLQQEFNNQIILNPLSTQEIDSILTNTRSFSVEPPEISYQIGFDLNKSIPSLSFEPTLKEIAKSFVEGGYQKISVVGHTDNQGGTAYNLKLSKDRAYSVAKKLIEFQPKLKGHLLIVGKGASELIAEGSTEEVHRLNRRVVFIIQK